MSQEDGGSGGEPVEAVVLKQVGLKKGPWTAAEDSILIDYVRRHGEGNWNSVQRNSGLMRCGKSCRLRWTNHLRPNLKKGAISAKEESLIIDLHAKFGNKWARMAAQLPGRTDNEIKNYWNTRLKRRLRAGLPIYPQEVQHQVSYNHNSLPAPPQQQQQPILSYDQNRSYDLTGTSFDTLSIPLQNLYSLYFPDSISNHRLEVLHENTKGRSLREFDPITPNLPLKYLNSNQLDSPSITTSNGLINFNTNQNMIVGEQAELHSIQNSDVLYKNAGVGYAVTPSITLSSHTNMIVPKCENVLIKNIQEIDPHKAKDSVIAGNSSTGKSDEMSELKGMDDELVSLVDFLRDPAADWYNTMEINTMEINTMEINTSSDNSCCFWNTMPTITSSTTYSES